MHPDFFAYLKRLELMAFFPGYVLWYLVVMTLSERLSLKDTLKSRLRYSLPYSYAFIATLYLGLQIRNIYPDFSAAHVKQYFGSFLPLQAWAFLALLFWLPGLAKRAGFTLLHSIVFFIVIVKDLVVYFRNTASPEAYDVLRNDMQLFTISLLLNIIAFAAVLVIPFILKTIKRGIIS